MPALRALTVLCLLSAWSPPPIWAAPVPVQPSSLRELHQQVDQLRSLHKVDEAANLTSEFVRTHRQDTDALILLAQLRTEQNQPSEALKVLAEALTISPNSPGANDLSGQLLLDRHHYPEAMERFEAVLSVNLRDGVAREGELTAATQLALDSRQAGRSEAALACLVHAREHLPDDPVLLRDLGIQAEQMQQLKLAQEALEAALALSPGDAKTLYALSRVELDAGHFPDSERHLRAYLIKHPEDATAHFGLGHLLQIEQRIDDAKAEFQRSIDLQPVQTESYFQLGQIALNAGQPELARPLFQKTLARDPHHGGALTGVGILAYRERDFAEARRELASAVESSPEYQPAHYYLGLTLARLGDKADSERELKIATELERKQDPYSSSAAQRQQEARP